jgi:hypothetical protein
VCAIEAWWERVTAHMEDAASDSLDVILFSSDCTKEAEPTWHAGSLTAPPFSL